MKRRAVRIRVTDHAVIRYLERVLDIDVTSLRAHIAGLAEDAAELGASGLKIDGIKLIIEPDRYTDKDDAHIVAIPTVLSSHMVNATIKAKLVRK